MKKQPSKTNWKNIEKEFEEKIRELTILIATAREEGDDDEHERVVKEIMKKVRQKHEALIKELGKEIEKMNEEMTFEEANKKAIEPDDYLFGHQEALSDIKELLKRYL